MSSLTDADLAACDVTSSGRLIAPESHATEWELCGGDTIRTKFAHGDPERWGVIVAQFWTRPSDENRALMVAAPELREAVSGLSAKAKALMDLLFDWDAGLIATPEWMHLTEEMIRADGLLKLTAPK